MAAKSSPEMDRFNAALRGVMQVPKSELKRILADEQAVAAVKQKPGRKAKSRSTQHP